ncbi:MAG: FAD-dependent thymidylate synthase [Nitrososphaerales archaeon]|nr:FAD-dependent thymidylate synthase [Nitrososphaerales archaeon]
MAKSKVVLVSYTPDLERVCASAMRSCYSQYGSSELYLSRNLLSDADVKRMLEKALQLGHYDIIEHGSLTYSLEDVSRVLTHQLVRHRIASFSQQSQRYVKMVGEKDWYARPPSIDEKEKVIIDLKGHKMELGYDDLMALSKQAYKAYSEKGLHKEDVRFITPSACKTNITITTNPREFRHIFSQRCDSTAQWEIRDVCWAMLSMAKLIAPTIFRAFDLPASRDSSAVGMMVKLDGMLSEYRIAFEKAEKGTLLEINLSELNLSHKVSSYVLKA